MFSLIIVHEIWRIIASTLIAYIVIFIIGRRSAGNMKTLLSFYLYILPMAILYDILWKFGRNAPFWFISTQLSLIAYGLGNITSLLVYWISALPLLVFPINFNGIVLYTISTMIPPLVLYISLSKKGLEYVRTAVIAVTDYKGDLFEQIIKGSEENITWNALLIKNGNRVKAILEPGIHYGPFKGVGSSDFPRYIVNLTDYKVLPLHGCGSHEKNVVSSNDMKRYVRYLFSKIFKSSENSCKPLIPFQGSYNDWSYLVFGCKKKPLILLWNIKGSEDISCDAVKEFLDKAIIVDSHCIETDKMSLFDIKEALKNALNGIEECRSETRCCLEFFHVDNNIIKEANLCENWFALFKQCCDNNCKTIVVIPSNNIEVVSSTRYMNALRGLAHMVTIDDHSCISDGSNKGALVWSDNFLKLVKDSIRNCVPSSCELSFKSGEVKLKLWGNDTFKELSDLMKRGKKAWYLVLGLYILPIVILVAYIV